MLWLFLRRKHRSLAATCAAHPLASFVIVSSGAIFQTIATLIFVWNLVASYFKGEKAGPDPWDAWTLEWATSSPPPSYNFAVIPTVESRRPLWDRKHPEEPDAHYE